MPFLIGNELAIFTMPGIQQKLGLDINMVGILLHETSAGYFTVHLQLFIIPCILRGMMGALPPIKQVQGYLFHPTNSLGFFEIGFANLKSIPIPGVQESKMTRG